MSRSSMMVHQVSPLIPFEHIEGQNFQGNSSFLWRDDGILELSYCFHYIDNNLLRQILLPASLDIPKRKTGLTSSTCFEAFFAIPNTDNYWEFNISPNGDWNLYTFNGYRHNKQQVATISQPHSSLILHSRGFRFHVLLNSSPWWSYSSIPDFSLSAVILDTTSSVSHWSLSHYSDQVDFHDRRNFISV